jgi:hypothetical protein
MSNEPPIASVHDSAASRNASSGSRSGRSLHNTVCARATGTLLPVSASVPLPSLVTVPPTLLRVPAKVTSWPLVSIENDWPLALLKRLE